ncbi:hypothetical protein AAMO2058_001699100 [Amorphochlora amoebiformis]
MSRFTRMRGISRELKLNKRTVVDVLNKAATTKDSPALVCSMEAMKVMACMSSNLDVAVDTICKKELLALAKCERTATREVALREKMRKSLLFQIMKKKR